MTKAIRKILIIAIILVLVVILLSKLKIIILKKLYPIQYQQYVEQYAQEYGVDPLLVYSVIKAESNFKENAKSSQKAVGLMQLMEETAKELANKIGMEYEENKTLYDPESNIRLGTKYLSELLEKYSGDYMLAVTAYNAGIGNVNKWIEEGTIKEDGSNIENIPFKETNNYVRKIIRNYRIYQELYRV